MPNILLALTYAWLHCCDGFKSLAQSGYPWNQSEEMNDAYGLWISRWNDSTRVCCLLQRGLCRSLGAVYRVNRVKWTLFGNLQQWNSYYIIQRRLANDRPQAASGRPIIESILSSPCLPTKVSQWSLARRRVAACSCSSWAGAGYWCEASDCSGRGACKCLRLHSRSLARCVVRENRWRLVERRVRIVDMAASAAPRHSIYPTAGREGKAIDKNLYTGSTIAVFTSGGDAQGMQ